VATKRHAPEQGTSVSRLVAALQAGFDGFDDGALRQAAVVAGVDAIMSRDGAGFAAASLPVFMPSAFLAAVRGELR